ncbi:hypothetical protein OSTOST_07642, partial [Ostertagia ostertagi]
MLPEIRQLLEFSENVQHDGDKVLQRWKLANATAMCAHIRRSDFVELAVATDLHKSVRDIESIAFQQGVDLYVASRACGAMLITAPTSTFGWWLAFFTPNQNSVFYSNDKRRMADKVPQKSLFL